METQSQTLGELAKALAAARAEFKPIKKDRTAKIKGTSRAGKDYEMEYHYADLAAVLDAITPALSKHGLALTQATQWSAGDSLLLLVTTLLHSSGEWTRGTYPLPNGAKAQELGSAITYGRRYTICCLVGVVGEDDDDGAAANEIPPKAKAEPKEPLISKGQAQAFFNAAQTAGLPKEEIKALVKRVAGVDSSAQIPAALFDALMDEIKVVA